MTTIVQALTAVMDQVGAVAKRDTNDSQHFNFRGIDAVVNAVSPALRDHGVVVVPELRSLEATTVEVGRNRTLMGHVRVEVAYTFHGPEGDTITAVVPGEAMDSGDKATPKAMSVAFRTALLQALALPTDEPDADASSYERSNARTQRGPTSMSDMEYEANVALIADTTDQEFLRGLWQEAGVRGDDTTQAACLARKAEIEAAA